METISASMIVMGISGSPGMRQKPGELRKKESGLR
jgi:hypothetical protein